MRPVRVYHRNRCNRHTVLTAYENSAFLHVRGLSGSFSLADMVYGSDDPAGQRRFTCGRYANQQVPFNNSGSYGASTNLTYKQRDKHPHRAQRERQFTSKYFHVI
jgi:hypothetical protein